MKKATRPNVPELGSVSKALQKADKYAKDGSRETDRKVKIAILKELNAHLVVKPQVLHSNKCNEKEYGSSKQATVGYPRLNVGPQQRSRVGLELQVKQRPQGGRSQGKIEIIEHSHQKLSCLEVNR